MNGEIKKQQLRKMSCELSLLSRPDGSASLSCGDTSMMASVYGPAEVKIAKEQINQATVEIVYKPKSGMANCAEKLKENLICSTCETAILACLHPRSSISITIQELQNSGSLLACAINVVCLSLLDASVNMNFMIAAVSCVFTENDQLILDPTLKEESSAPISMMFVFDSVSKSILAIHTSGLFDKTKFNSALVACRAASDEIFTFYREIMQKNFSKS
ncbi:exosome complex component RRP46 [Octopus sinensis]|uniref:Exosome complex component RRP46 n=1 Tax=Octopus sinensis TaxID=2607531 RepID=A0A6P7SEW2_9MOLL|nr:exosome complex component RRP46 [Octopus sinensis]XP_036359125.1 exosome complex component RRP46 [Octopus sinensis]XP_036359126.1 exosome complex component RRP46 [Octopus sinensis]